MIITKLNSLALFGNTALAGAAGGGGLIYWLDTHSNGLGAVAVVIVALTGVIFKWLAHKELKRHHKKIEDG